MGNEKSPFDFMRLTQNYIVCLSFGKICDVNSRHFFEETITYDCSHYLIKVYVLDILQYLKTFHTKISEKE